MKRFTLTSILLVVLACLFLPQNASAEDVAEKLPRTVVPAGQAHDRHILHTGYRAALAKGNVDVLMVGDYRMSEWSKAPYLFFYSDRRCVNMAVFACETQVALYNMNNAPMDKSSPKVVMLEVGIRNLENKDTPEDTALGIKACVDKLQGYYPNAKILVLDVFVAQGANDPLRQQITATNAKMRELLKNYKNVKIMDINDLWLNEKGEIQKELMEESGKLTYKGYMAFGNRIEPVVAEMLGVKAKELKY